MSQTIQIKCPNCQIINNVNREAPLSIDDNVLLFDCGKCGKEISVECSIIETELEEENEV